MNRYAKTKLLFLAIAAIVVTILSHSSLAYYAYVDTADNVVTSGAIQLKIHEKTAAGNEYPKEGILIMPGSIVSKQVTIENLCNHPFYLRLEIVNGIDSTTLTVDECLELDINEKDWTYVDGYYYYNDIVPPHTTTTPIFTEVEIVGDKVDNSYIGRTLSLTVNAFAVQSENNFAENPWNAEGWPIELPESEGSESNDTAPGDTSGADTEEVTP